MSANRYSLLGEILGSEIGKRLESVFSCSRLFRVATVVQIASLYNPFLKFAFVSS